VDYSSAAPDVVSSGRKTLSRLHEIKMVIDDPRLSAARNKMEAAVALDPKDTDAERIQAADEDIRAAKQLLSLVREEHLREIRGLDLDKAVSVFEKDLRQYASPSEAADFDNLAVTARRSIDRDDADFEFYFSKLENMNFGIQWKQDWYIVELFKRWTAIPQIFIDRTRFDELAARGKELIASDDAEKLREVMMELLKLIPGVGPDINMSDVTNIIRG
jgi:molecular chaperone DnaK